MKRSGHEKQLTYTYPQLPTVLTSSQPARAAPQTSLPHGNTVSSIRSVFTQTKLQSSLQMTALPKPWEMDANARRRRVALVPYPSSLVGPDVRERKMPAWKPSTEQQRMGTTPPQTVGLGQDAAELNNDHQVSPTTVHADAGQGRQRPTSGKP